MLCYTNNVAISTCNRATVMLLELYFVIFFFKKTHTHTHTQTTQLIALKPLILILYTQAHLSCFLVLI